MLFPPLLCQHHCRSGILHHVSETLRRIDRSDNWQKRPHWRGRINRKHLRPWWKKGRLRAYASNREEMVPYAGQVHGLIVPDGLVCCLRGDKTYWACDGGR